MSDPIAEHLYSLGHWKDRKIVDRLSKQIRQQIGREFKGTFEVWANNPSSESLIELIDKFFQLEEE